jgi:hypothetical protein
MTKANSLSWRSVKNYLGLIGMISDIDISQVREIVNQGEILCPEELKMLFISNYKETNGKDKFKDLWLFSDNCLIEVLSFNKQETFKFDIIIFRKNIHTIAIETSNLNFSQSAKDDSKLHIEFYTLNDFSCDQLAYGRNCDVLMSIYKKYLIPNLVSGQTLRQY